MAKDDALAVKGLEALGDFISTERPEGADEGLLGNEHIGRADVAMPYLALTQKTSPEIDPTSPRYIEGLQFTDLYNSITRKNYGKGPLHFIILRADPPRWIEFNPIDEGGGVKDMNVPAGDPRTEYWTDAQGIRQKPLATKFYDFIVLILNGLNEKEPLQNIVSFSLKSTGLKVAMRLNMLINQRGAKKIYKGVYTVKSGADSSGQNTYAVYKVDNAGWLKPGSPLETAAGELYDMWQAREVKVHRSDDDATSFNPKDIEEGM
jgi:hypothetical protein